jgi:hypothetical protein
MREDPKAAAKQRLPGHLLPPVLPEEIDQPMRRGDIGADGVARTAAVAGEVVVPGQGQARAAWSLVGSVTGDQPAPHAARQHAA